MRQRVHRILELVAQERLGHDDAARLLEALSPKLALSEEARPHLFGLLQAPDFGVDRVSELLLVRAGVGRGPTVQVRSMDDLGRQIGSVVETALDGAFGPGRPPRPGRVLRVMVEQPGERTLRANLPLSLAEHAGKLLPPQVIETLHEQGITIDALVMLLSSNPPSGDLITIEEPGDLDLRLRVE